MIILGISVMFSQNYRDEFSSQEMFHFDAWIRVIFREVAPMRFFRLIIG